MAQDVQSCPRVPTFTAVYSRNHAECGCLGTQIVEAVGFGALRGLLGRDGLDVGEGMYFPSTPCGALHSIAMRFEFDALYLDRAGRVRRVLHCVQPGRLCVWDFRTVAALELPAGVARDVRIGDVVHLQPTELDASGGLGNAVVRRSMSTPV